MKMAVGLRLLPGPWWYPAFVSNKNHSPRAPIIQLIWGNSSMLCKRLSVAMVRDPWRPPPTQPPPPPFSSSVHSSSCPPSPPLWSSCTGTLECEGEEGSTEAERERDTAQLGGGLNWWAGFGWRQRSRRSRSQPLDGRMERDTTCSRDAMISQKTAGSETLLWFPLRALTNTIQAAVSWQLSYETQATGAGALFHLKLSSQAELLG